MSHHYHHHHQHETEQVNTNETDIKIDESDNVTSNSLKIETNAPLAKTAAQTASSSLNNRDEPLEEVEKIRTYLARKSSVSHIPEAQVIEDVSLEFSSSINTTNNINNKNINNNNNNSNDIILIDETIGTTVVSETVDDDIVAQHINETKENKQLQSESYTQDDDNTSKDLESGLNCTETVVKSLLDNNMTFVTREALPTETSESDSLENYMIQFQTTSSLLNKETGKDDVV